MRLKVSHSTEMKFEFKFSVGAKNKYFYGEMKITYFQTNPGLM